jgi:hypothetical protein
VNSSWIEGVVVSGALRASAPVWNAAQLVVITAGATPYRECSNAAGWVLLRRNASAQTEGGLLVAATWYWIYLQAPAFQILA